VVLATRNAGKVAEFMALLADFPIQVYSLEAFPQIPPLSEDGMTYTENAISKALTVARLTGRVAIAEDSGIEVEALQGAPGPASHRFLGEGASDSVRNSRLVQALRDMPESRRHARYRAIVAVASPNGSVRTFEGTCEGAILLAPRGSHGFGYDPIFLVPELGKSMGQLPLATKNRISHRAQALTKAKPYLRQLFRASRGLPGD
jgi:XTP/dITP diphosphohydrolase